jgi:hypothetical protein
MIDDLISTLEVVRDAVWAKDKDKGFEAITVFLLQFLEFSGTRPALCLGCYPFLKS